MSIFDGAPDVTDFSNYEHPDSKKSELSSKVTAHSAVTVSQSRTVISSIQMKNSVDFEPPCQRSEEVNDFRLSPI